MILADGFADAVVEYETADRDSEYDLNSKAKELLTWIEYAKTNRVVIDNNMLKELKKCQEEKSKFEKLDQISKSVIKQLTNDKESLTKKIERHYKRYEKLEEIDSKEDNNAEDSEVTRG